MRTALCLSGQPRSLIECYGSIKENIILPNNADVFIHTWHDPKLVGQKYRNDPRFKAVQPPDLIAEIYNLYNPKMFIHEPQIQFPLGNFDSVFQPGDKYFIFAIQSMFYSIYKSNELKRLYERMRGFSYEYVIRSRFDLKFENELDITSLDTKYIYLKHDCKHSSYCRNDHFAVGSSKNMDVYAGTWTKIYQLYENKVVPWCGEEFLGMNLLMNTVETRDIPLSWYPYERT